MRVQVVFSVMDVVLVPRIVLTVVIEPLIVNVSVWVVASIAGMTFCCTITTSPIVVVEFGSVVVV